MREDIKLFLIVVACVVVLAYIGFALYVYFFPQNVFYHPNKDKPDLDFARQEITDLQEIVDSTNADKKIFMWYAKPKNAKKAVIFFHGNAGNVGNFLARVKPFYKKGYAVLLPEYEGFGGIVGKPSQHNMEQATDTAVRFLNAQGFKNKDIVLYGHSLGTYMATYAAAHNQSAFDAVILESPFTSVARVADKVSYYLFPVSLLIPDSYNSYDLIDKVGTRVFVAHGTDDPTVPYNMGVQMFEKAKGNKMFFSKEGAGHLNLPDNGFLEVVLNWLDERTQLTKN